MRMLERCRTEVSGAGCGLRYKAIGETVTRAKHALSKVEGAVSIHIIANSKLEIRNSKQFQMIKNQKVPNKPVSDFVIGI